MALKYPIGVQTFGEIIEKGYVYVDKTDLVHSLANELKYVFLSRPRRFGKSLLISTLEAYFSGKRELFKGLAIDSLETEWESYPVLRLDLNNGNYTDGTEELNNKIEQFLATYERDYNVPQEGKNFGDRFGALIKNICKKTGKQVVFLVDEYDKPLIANVEREKEELQTELRNILKAFYGNVKSSDAYIRFAMFTGVSRFSHVSIFSDLNNLSDISLDRRYGTLCGITEDELHRYFDEGVTGIAQDYGISKDEAYDTLKRMYDGFCFSRDGRKVYNLWSVINALNKRNFGSYWYQSGTPTFLIDLIHEQRIDLTSLDGNIEAMEETMITYEDDSNFIAPLYQTGYLTIKGFDRWTQVYTLGIPNMEVEKAFNLNLLPRYSRLSRPQTDALSGKIYRSAQAGDVDTLLSTIKGILAEAPVESGDERVIELNYRNLIAIALRMSGLDCHIERPTSAGRIDLALETDNHVYIMEFKRTSVEAAARQITGRAYADRYINDTRQVVKLAIELDDTVRNISRWQVVE